MWSRMARMDVKGPEENYVLAEGKYRNTEKDVLLKGRLWLRKRMVNDYRVVATL